MDKAQATIDRLSQPITLATLAIAFWPLWGWYVARTMDKSDEPWGICALITAAALLLKEHFWKPQATQEPAAKLFDLAGIGALLLYIGTYHWAPSLAQSVLAVLALWSLVVVRVHNPSSTGMLGLLMLSLPVIPSLNFFAGYPLRLIVTYGVCVLLNALGLPAVQESTMIKVNNELIAVDAPCSGISMLWAEAYVVALCACLFRFSFTKTSLLSIIGLGLVLVGNTIRATALSVSSQLDWKSIAHAPGDLEAQIHIGVGLLIFCAVAVATMLAAQRIAAKNAGLSVAGPHCMRPVPESDVPLDAAESREPGSPAGAAPNEHKCAQNATTTAKSLRKNTILVMALAGIAALAPLAFHHDSKAAPDNHVTWPTTINGHTLRPVASPSEEQAFAAEFPGNMKRFSDGKRAYFVRVVNRETRQLHPSSDCFRGLGYTTEPKPLVVMEDGSTWGCFEATKADTKLRILERIYDDHGQSWTDVSQWYWSAAFGRTKGPWFDITIAQPI